MLLLFVVVGLPKVEKKRKTRTEKRNPHGETTARLTGVCRGRDEKRKLNVTHTGARASG